MTIEKLIEKWQRRRLRYRRKTNGFGDTGLNIRCRYAGATVAIAQCIRELRRLAKELDVTGPLVRYYRAKVRH